MKWRKKKKNEIVPLRLLASGSTELAPTAQILIKGTPWMRVKLDYGDDYILDLNGKVMDNYIDRETGPRMHVGRTRKK